MIKNIARASSVIMRPSFSWSKRMNWDSITFVVVDYLRCEGSVGGQKGNVQRVIADDCAH